mgnify:CR=1 FL=1
MKSAMLYTINIAHFFLLFNGVDKLFPFFIKDAALPIAK